MDVGGGSGSGFVNLTFQVQRGCELTCGAQAGSGSSSRLRGSVAVLLPPFAAGGAGGADVHLADFKEGHHERLLLQRAVTPYKPRLLTADAPPWSKR